MLTLQEAIWLCARLVPAIPPSGAVHALREQVGMCNAQKCAECKILDAACPACSFTCCKLLSGCMCCLRQPVQQGVATNCAGGHATQSRSARAQQPCMWRQSGHSPQRPRDSACGCVPIIWLHSCWRSICMQSTWMSCMDDTFHRASGLCSAKPEEPCGERLRTFHIGIVPSWYTSVYIVDMQHTRTLVTQSWVRPGA